jgi:hypothetical protein
MVIQQRRAFRSGLRTTKQTYLTHPVLTAHPFVRAEAIALPSTMSDSTTVPPPAAVASSTPSLGNLLPELKAIIVEMVDRLDRVEKEDQVYLHVSIVDDDEREERGAQDHEHGEDCGHDHERPYSRHVHAYKCVHYEVCPYFDENAPAEPSSISNLSLVNTEFACLAQPYLWKVSFVRLRLDGTSH